MRKGILLLMMVGSFALSYSENNRPQGVFEKYLVVGSYSDGSTSGISVYRFDTRTGDFGFVSDIKGILNPSYLVVSPDEKFIYSTNEERDGAVTAFSFDKKEGALTFLNSQSMEGAHPCYINIDKGQNFIVTANYTGGNISYFPLAKDGHIEPISDAWDMGFKTSRMHSVVFSPDNRYLFATDLGLDKIYRFNVEKDFSLDIDLENTTFLPKGSGPRHLSFHPNKKFLYCINELSGTISVFEYKKRKKGALKSIQTIASDTTNASTKGSADIHLTPDGRFLYSSNRLKADGIAIFSVNSKTGKLTKVGYQETGIHPRNFIISPNGKFLLCANRNSNSIQIFKIDPNSGLLNNTGKEILLDQPVCLKWIE